ncbi:sialin-like isoform X2 [Clavelina lepadiformis]|uniref:sialin-like isoform X2 n=1 Tax=Clavelina lepadiformis TaxID=159417 RepID=UPI00404311EB
MENFNTINTVNEAAIYPAMNYAWAKWAPPLEISVLNSISLSGMGFGLTLVNPLVGVISDALGWDAAFYVTGSMALVWLVFFFIFTSDAPSNNRWISKKERRYIEKSIENRENKTHDEFQGPQKTTSIPWKAMLASKCSWALFIAHSADAWFQYTFAALMPTYMAEMYNFDTTQSGLLMILPFLMQFLVSLPASCITDMLRKKRRITTTQIRKINTFLALSVPALCLSLAGYVGRDHRAVIALFTCGYAFTGLTFPGYLSCPLDIAPRHSGILFAISNTIANLVGFLGPFSAGYIITDYKSLLQWQILFWASFGISIAGAITFVTFGSGVEQNWAKKQNCKKRKQSTKSEVENRSNLL